MNRYPWWKYAILAIALLVGLVYTLPNFFGEAPAVQVSSAKATLKVDSALVPRIEQALQQAGVRADFVQFEGTSVKVRFSDTDTQLKAKDAISRGLNADPNDPSYIVALNLVSRSPLWLPHLRALPMFLGLDLRGGVHFLMQVDMKSALAKKAEGLTGDVRTLLRDKNIRHAGITRNGNVVDVRFRDAATLQQALTLLNDTQPDLQWDQRSEGGDFILSGSLKPQAARAVQEAALKQNITTLHNRVNELGVSEPVIQQQGIDRVVVQLPGVQDTAKAKDIIGRTATLEMRMVDDSESNRRWSAALWHLDRLVETEPKCWQFCRRRGQARAELGDWQNAAADYACAVDNMPPECAAATWCSLALIHWKLGDTAGYRRCCDLLFEVGHVGFPAEAAHRHAPVHGIPHEIRPAIDIQGLLFSRDGEESTLGPHQPAFDRCK